MSAVYVISDTHFGHRNILKYRPEFSTIEEHDQTIMEGIRSLNKRDSLWILGDCFFTWDSLRFLGEMCSIVDNVNWIFGNHDTDRAERQQVLRHALMSFPLSKVGSMFKYGKHFWLTHYPIHPAELRGRRNIHGHVHRETIKDTRYINVCCEALDYKPVNIQTLV